MIGIAVLKKFCEATAAPIAKQACLPDILGVAADHVCDLHKGALLEFHNFQRNNIAPMESMAQL